MSALQVRTLSEVRGSDRAATDTLPVPLRTKSPDSLSADMHLQNPKP